MGPCKHIANFTSHVVLNCFAFMRGNNFFKWQDLRCWGSARSAPTANYLPPFLKLSYVRNLRGRDFPQLFFEFKEPEWSHIPPLNCLSMFWENGITVIMNNMSAEARKLTQENHTIILNLNSNFGLKGFTNSSLLLWLQSPQGWLL